MSSSSVAFETLVVQGLLRPLDLWRGHADCGRSGLCRTRVYPDAEDRSAAERTLVDGADQRVGMGTLPGAGSRLLSGRSRRRQVRVMSKHPEIVWICGSARSMPEMRVANGELTRDGVVVLAPSEVDESPTRAEGCPGRPSPVQDRPGRPGTSRQSRWVRQRVGAERSCLYASGTQADQLHCSAPTMSHVLIGPTRGRSGRLG